MMVVAMSNFAEITAMAAFDAFGEAITFNGHHIQGIPSTETVSLGVYEQVMEQRFTVSVLAKDVPKVEKGQSVMIRGREYWVDQLVSGDDDPDVVVKVVLR